jgi:hypothetical protein
MLSNPKEHMIPIWKVHSILKNTYNARGKKTPNLKMLTN